MLELARAIELVAKLDRTINYPREGPGVVNLAKGLQKASDALRVDGGRIIERCADTSQYCPTDADLLTIARDISRLDAVTAGDYDSMRSAGNWAQSKPNRERCERCHDSGWVISWWLHTHEGGGYNYIKKEQITEQQEAELRGKIDAQKQVIYSAASRCKCPVPGEPKGAA